MSEHNDALNTTNPEHAEHHILGPGTYGIIYATLLCLTGLTVWAAYWPMGVFNPIVALLIATIKGVVVILWFMHVKFQSRLIKMTVGAGFFTFFVLILMTMSDYISRAWGSW